MRLVAPSLFLLESEQPDSTSAAATPHIVIALVSDFIVFLSWPNDFRVELESAAGADANAMESRFRDRLDRVKQSKASACICQTDAL
ncbi:hypothetical protein [Mycolicibacterium diernhoferi]|uniref:Uncharacterized protein n=1 Tax=Mycolicibacterium diernhoferi TaxID=1801 RepID=A0A1Q4H8X2_9MYCO|nr:hypothetical protein [Mycolicibacterium diernhoferi]OJZ63953.1 hypothetical protein BRW64_19665 [Mycolicibacterium diernhoferi]OPE55994.1 hypothetical protein BV510_02145 [Mycolicibacterium diernhoferi]QYL20641.1 hypothetical protein K0O62_16285 [Mycolicibacterium diernhoferi]